MTYKACLTNAEVLEMTLQERCDRILDAFDTWLAIQVLHLKLKHEDLPLLNDAFRDYFAGTRAARDLERGGSR